MSNISNYYYFPLVKKSNSLNFMQTLGQGSFWIFSQASQWFSMLEMPRSLEEEEKGEARIRI